MEALHQKKILVFINHPADYHLLKNVLNRLKMIGYPITILIVTKDVLEALVKKEGWEYTNLFPSGRRLKGILRIFSAPYFFVQTFFRLAKFVSKTKPDVMVGTERTIAHVGFLKKIPTLFINQDDTMATKENKITYPFVTNVLMPSCCDVGQWDKKKITYNGYYQLAYLRPKYFQPDAEVVKRFNPEGKRYFIVRLAELSASHDIGKRGIDDALLEKLIGRLEKEGKVFICAERKLKGKFEPYRLPTAAHEIHHALAFADLYIGDSQSMAAEAAVLGVPSIRFNDFIGKLSYLNELETKYELTVGIKRREPEKLFEKIDEFFHTPKLKEHWKNKRKVLLVESEDVVEFFINAIRLFAEKGKL